MRRIVVVENLTLDGVVQAPGAPEEDTRGGFTHGGWARPYGDEVMAAEMRKGMGTSELLFGRWTYESFFSYWPHAPQPNPFTDYLDATSKYVVSTTLSAPLPWQNSTLLTGDAMAAVAKLKEQPGKDLTVLGSAELVRSLLSHGLVDELVLSIHPLALGAGRRLFPGGGVPTRLGLVQSVTTTTGVVIATYRPVDGAV